MRDDKIMEAVDYIENNLDDKLGIDEIAEEVGYSKFHLHRLFLERVGYTPYQYIKQRRLTRAAEQLVHTTKPIIDIAHDANYDSQQSFTFAFKQLYFCTPQRYRTIGIYTPKINRFRIDNMSIMNYTSAMKCEVRAA